jgi:DHA1 family bicyclomycin/chloramphenicol resistance-like MFS transporter
MHASKFLDRNTPPHIVTLVILSGIGALSLNMFLPSLPAMAEYFEVEYAAIQFAISGYLAGTAVIQIVIGPLSDRYGRRPVLIASLIIFLIATAVAGFAESYPVFIAARIVQVVVATGLALSRAIVRDLYEMDQAASMIGYVTMGMALMPMVGPVIGGLLEEQFGWQSTLATLFIMGAGVLALVYFDLGETNHNTSQSLTQQIGELPELMRSRRFWGYAICAMFTSGAFFSYLGGGPFVATKILGLSPSAMGLYFGLIAFGYMIGNFISGRYAVRLGPHTLILVGGIITTVGVALALLLAMVDIINPISILGPFIFLGIGNGLTLPSSNAGMVSVRPHLAGTASGFGGALMIGGGAALATLTGYLLEITPTVFPLLIVMLISAIMAVLTALYIIHIARQVATTG